MKDRLICQARGYNFAVLTYAKVYTEPLQPVVHLTFVLPACMAHTVRLPACVSHALRQFGDVKSPHTPLIVQMVDAQSFERGQMVMLHGPKEQQAAEEVLVHSDHPAHGRATKNADKLSAAHEP